eukprot:5166364-Alexandrium_andersonii.AAC.1
MGRKAPASVVQGVRYTQARSIRIMHAHYRRTIGKSSAGVEPDDVDDETLQHHLNAYAAAVDGNTLGTIDEAAASVGEESKAGALESSSNNCGLEDEDCRYRQSS